MVQISDRKPLHLQSVRHGEAGNGRLLRRCKPNRREAIKVASIVILRKNHQPRNRTT